MLRPSPQILAAEPSAAPGRGVARRVCATLLAIALGLAPVAGSLSAEEGGGQSTTAVTGLFEEGLQHFRAGRVAEAAVSFGAMLKLNPSDRLAYDLYLSAGDLVLERMRQRDQLRDVLDPLLRKARFYQTGLRRDPAYHEILITKLRGSSEEDRVVAGNELVAVGPIAVPKLLGRLGDNRQDEFRVVCRVVLTRMGHRAVPPLIEALGAKNQRLLASVVTILGDIGDVRALPRLQLLSAEASTDATLKRVVDNTIAAIVKANRIERVGSVEELHYAEALRYFRDGDLVRDELVASESLLWRWVEPQGGAEDGDAIVKALTYVRAPAYAWNELVAEEILYDLANARPGFAPAYALLAADLAAQDIEPRLRDRVAKESPRPPSTPEGFPAAIAERVAAANGGGSGLIDRVRAMGPAVVYAGFQQAVVAGRFEAVGGLAGVLADRTIARPELHLPNATTGFSRERLGTPLVAALDHPSKSVRYPAAVALAHLDSAQPHLNAEKVIPVLAQAVGEAGLRAVVVVDQDYRHRNVARAALQSKGFMARAVEDGFALMQTLEEAPVKDAIIIPGDLLPTVRGPHGGLSDVPEQKAETLVDALAKDQRTAKTPVFISLPEDPVLAAKVQTAFTGKVAGFVRKPYNAVELHGAIDQALRTAGEPPNVNREDAEAIALAAAKALQAPDPMRTQFQLAGAADALIKTLEVRRVDALRIEACKALVNASRQPAAGGLTQYAVKLCDLYTTEDGSMAAPMRAAWIEAIGAIAPSVPVAQDLVSRALAHDDAGVRAAAAVAAGRIQAATGTVIPADGGALLRFLNERRMDLRTQGAGSETR